ncbi:hypothetical protein RUMOBE_00267 [Blautia obeum ATCC 29174]|uniref:Uncharacterized protein n=1 Tax=Blautia obeum ATCC 29174 TaxID=411459 RepID=A5ZMP9_9FIRM|nr:hypothetical protein RUMOBE_00267 [Blautia obeum ATCC 29174]
MNISKMSRCMPSGCFFITKIERYIKKQSILFNISIWYYNFIKKLYEIAKEQTKMGGFFYEEKISFSDGSNNGNHILCSSGTCR